MNEFESYKETRFLNLIREICEDFEPTPYQIITYWRFFCGGADARKDYEEAGRND